jgi:hypothetical protein
MKHSIATKEEAAAFWKERKERLGDHAVISIPIMSGRRTPSPARPDTDAGRGRVSKVEVSDQVSVEKYTYSSVVTRVFNDDDYSPNK